MDDGEKIDRRTFIEKAGFYSFWLTLAASVAGVVKFLMPDVFDEPSTSFRLGKPEEFTKDGGTRLEDKNLMIFKDPEGLYAISAICTHLGCIVGETPAGFACPCHGSRFDKQGIVAGGPAPRNLPWFKIYLSPEGYLMVDTAATVTIGEKFKI
ncbi:MAG: ubiquinol-cytochrome c reductase iron-sulfur subunit [Candidatus Schekmanbacteria bacterium]|nr:ubiquinol-cytochrome c reductase iron-sulfur subunit [Candidatus Schekmanbacteria bacterium]